MMRLSVRLLLLFAAPVVLSSSALAQTQVQDTAQSPDTPPRYVHVDPLAGVRYDNRYDLSLGLAYNHMKAGPNLLQGANLGGLSLSGSYWFARRWAVEGSARAYAGTSGAGTNPYNIEGPFVMQNFFVGGAEWLGPHNKHGDLMAHVLVGTAQGSFENDLRGLPPYTVGFYNDQFSPAAIVGGHIDLNRSAHWVFRITPDAMATHYHYQNQGPGANPELFTHHQFDVNFGISVGVAYKFRQRRF